MRGENGRPRPDGHHGRRARGNGCPRQRNRALRLHPHGGRRLPSGTRALPGPGAGQRSRHLSVQRGLRPGQDDSGCRRRPLRGGDDRGDPRHRHRLVGRHLGRDDRRQSWRDPGHDRCNRLRVGHGGGRRYFREDPRAQPLPNRPRYRSAIPPAGSAPVFVPGPGVIFRQAGRAAMSRVPETGPEWQA